jgi:hypothetical protein
MNAYNDWPRRSTLVVYRRRTHRLDRFADRSRYALVVIHQGCRRTATRFRALTRRLQGRRPSLPPVTQ